MRTPYVPHVFGDAAIAKARTEHGWLTAGVASSIAWTEDDVLVEYDGVSFLLRSGRGGMGPVSPCISTHCERDDTDVALARVLRFVSVLGWYKRGYVDVVGHIWSTHPMLYGHPRDVFTTLTQGGGHGFDCNHMPIIENDQIRKALAFMREGRRLRHVHQAYSFLSFFKVLESQMTGNERKVWVGKSVELLSGPAGTRVAALKATGVDVGDHIFTSGRCAVAHASIGGDIVDPDIPADRRRIGEDLEVISALAARYISEELCVPDEMTVLDLRDRLKLWHPAFEPDGLSRLLNGETWSSANDIGKLHGAKISVRLWREPQAAQLANMHFVGWDSDSGSVMLRANNERGTIFLCFEMDVENGRMHVLLDDCHLTAQNNTVTEEDVISFTHFVHSVIGNRLVELVYGDLEPVDCDVVIPVNIVPRAPAEAVAEALERFRQQTDKPESGSGG